MEITVVNREEKIEDNCIVF